VRGICARYQPRAVIHMARDARLVAEVIAAVWILTVGTEARAVWVLGVEEPIRRWREGGGRS
jgi:hypothetical protein